MKAIIYGSLGHLDVGTLDKPQLSPDTVLVKIASCGVCHTDIDVLHGRYGESTFPLVPGHEFAGVVEQVGDAVSTVSVGDRVVVDPNISCGQCRACLRGLRNLCETLQAYGVTTNGGFAEYCVVRAANIYPIGNMPFALAALAEPLGCVLNGVGEIEVDGASNALIFGGGPIGLLMALALKDCGIPTVSVVDIDRKKIEFIEGLGLDAILSGTQKLDDLHQSVDVVVDATGVPSVVEGLLKYVANGGSVLLFGVCPPDSQVSFSPFEIFRRQIRIAGSHSLNHNIPDALAVLSRVGDTMLSVISHQLNIEEIAPFLQKAGGAGSMKVQYQQKDPVSS